MTENVASPVVGLRREGADPLGDTALLSTTAKSFPVALDFTSEVEKEIHELPEDHT